MKIKGRTKGMRFVRVEKLRDARSESHTAGYKLGFEAGKEQGYREASTQVQALVQTLKLLVRCE